MVKGEGERVKGRGLRVKGQKERRNLVVLQSFMKTHVGRERHRMPLGMNTKEKYNY